MGWLREESVEQKIFAGGKDGSPTSVCFRNLAKLALSEDEVKSIRVPVLILFGDNDSQEGLCRTAPDGAQGLAGDLHQGCEPYHVHPRAAIPRRNRQMDCPPFVPLSWRQ